MTRQTRSQRSEPGRFRIGAWQIDPSANEISRQGRRQRLAPKAIAVLVLLQRHRGAVVTRDQLCDAVGLSDEGLNRTVAELRSALDDRSRPPRYIETIPRRGYRLAADRAGVPRRRLLVGVVATIAVLGATVFWRLSLGQRISLSEPLQLTALPGSASAPRVVGDSVYFHWLEADDQPRGVWSVAIADLRSRRLTDDDVDLQLPQPDGEFVARIRRGSAGCQLEVGLDAAPALHRVACLRAGPDAGVDWSPDGQLLVFEGESGLSMLRLPSAEIVALTEHPPGRVDITPRVSPNGRQVSFIRRDAIAGELHVVDLQTDALRRLTFDNQMVFAADWTSDRGLVMVSDRSGQRRFWLGQVAEPDSWEDAGATDALTLDLVGDLLVYEEMAYDADIFHVAEGVDRPLISSNGYDNHPRLSPDGRRIAFLSNRSGPAAIWVADVEGGGQRMLISAATGRYTRPVWIDDNTLAVVAYDGGQQWIERVGLSGHSELLVPAELAPAEAVATAEGLWFAGTDPVGSGLFLRRPDGRIEPVVRGEVRRIEENGRGAVFLTLASGPELYRLTPSRELVVVHPALDHPRHWAVLDHYLAVADESGVQRLNLETGQQERISTRPANTVGLGLAFAGSADRVLVASVVDQESDIYARRLR